VEFAIFLVGLLVLVFGLVDFARLFSTQQVLINLSREGANLASRGTELVDAVNAMAASATPLNIDRDGYVIITVVQRDSGNRLTIVAQQARGGRSFNSRVGSILNPTAVNMPSSEIPQRNQTATIAEVFYVFRSATPVGRLTGIVMPTSLYDIAYF
jgi:Flp pilus assembly protein TadG